MADEPPIPLAPPPAPPQRARIVCPACLKTVRLGEPSCTHCGRVFEHGLEIQPDLCAQCGYDLTGIQSQRCPECGTRRGTTSKDSEVPPPIHAAAATAVMNTADTATGRALLPSLIACPLAAIIVLGIALTHGLAEAGLEAACLVVGAVAGTLLVMGMEKALDIDDAPWWLTLARASAAYAVVRVPAACFFLATTFGFRWSSGIPIVVTEVVAAFAVYWLFDTEHAQDAVFLSVPITLLAIGLPPLVQVVL